MKREIARILLVTLLIAMVGCSTPRHELTIDSARWTKSLNQPGFGERGMSYQAKDGYSFLVVGFKAKFDSPTSIDADDFAVIGSDGMAHLGVGGHNARTAFLEVEGSERYTFDMPATERTPAGEHSMSVVFSIPAVAGTQSFSMQYKSGPLVPFAIK